jgi:hypothetical protein
MKVAIKAAWYEGSASCATDIKTDSDAKALEKLQQFELEKLSLRGNLMNVYS